jgi:hypothetical protein
MVWIGLRRFEPRIGAHAALRVADHADVVADEIAGYQLGDGAVAGEGGVELVDRRRLKQGAIGEIEAVDMATRAAHPIIAGERGGGKLRCVGEIEDALAAAEGGRDGVIADKLGETRRDDADGGELAGAVCGAFLTAYSERGGLARTFQQLIRLKSDYAVRWRLASQGAMARLATRLRRVRPGLAGEQALFLAYALVTMIVSKLDLVYVYRGRSGAQAAASRAALAGELGELWTRMAAGPGQA